MTYFGNCLLGQPIFRQTLRISFSNANYKESQKKKLKRFIQNAVIAIRAFEAHFANFFKVTFVQDCENNKLLEQRFIKVDGYSKVSEKKNSISLTLL